MDFSFDSDVTAASTQPLFEYSTGGGSCNTRSCSTEVDIFKSDGFSEFTLDLSCLSDPSSPASLSSTPLIPEHILPVPSPPSPLPTPVEKSPNGSPVPEESPPKLSTMNRASSMMRMSLPAMKYIGRGTPVDPGRRSEWGGRKSEDVTEDGMLFSGDRARSLDCHSYPQRRSLSSDWQSVPGPRTLSPLHMDLDSFLEDQSQKFIEPLPESSKIQIQVDSDPAEWESVMQTVLGSSGSSSSPNPPLDRETAPSRRNSQGPVPGLPQHPNGFDIVLGLNSALDLGLGLGKGMNFFDLGLIPDTGRDTPSVYSLAPESPEPTQPPSEDKANHELGSSENSAPFPEHMEQQQEQHSSDDGISGSTAAEVVKSPAVRDVRKGQWWQRAVSKLRKVQKFIKTPSRL